MKYLKSNSIASLSGSTDRRNFVQLMGATAGAALIPLNHVQAAPDKVTPLEFIMKIKGRKITIRMAPVGEEDIEFSIQDGNSKTKSYGQIDSSKLTKEQMSAKGITVNKKEYAFDVQTAGVTTNYPGLVIEGPEEEVASRGIWKKIWRVVKAVIKILAGALLEYFGVKVDGENIGAIWMKEGFETLLGGELKEKPQYPGL